MRIFDSMNEPPEVEIDEVCGLLLTVHSTYVVEAARHALLLYPARYDCTNVTLATLDGEVMLSVKMRLPQHWVGHRLRIVRYTVTHSDGRFTTLETLYLDGQLVHELRTFEKWNKRGHQHLDEHE